MPECVKNQSFSKEEVSAILETHSSWESSAKIRAANVLQQLPQLVPTDEDPLLVFSESELRGEQLRDPVLSRCCTLLNVADARLGEKNPKSLSWSSGT